MRPRTAKAARDLAGVSAMPKIERTGQGLRDALFDEIDMLRSGQGDRRRAMAIAALAKNLVETVKVEIEYAKQQSLIAAAGDESVQLGALRLGR